MPATTIYFAQISANWLDWVQIVNISDERAKVNAIARNHLAKAVWSGEKDLAPFQVWTLDIEGFAGEACLVLNSTHSIIGERHMHSGKEVMSFPAASAFGMTVGRRIFFPQVAAGWSDWVRVLNVGEAEANINALVRDNSGNLLSSINKILSPSFWWDLSDKEIGNLNGTLEIISTQPVVGERHMYSGGVSIGQLGQAIG